MAEKAGSRRRISSKIVAVSIALIVATWLMVFGIIVFLFVQAGYI